MFIKVVCLAERKKEEEEGKTIENSMNFYLWRHLKAIVYSRLLRTLKFFASVLKKGCQQI